MRGILFVTVAFLVTSSVSDSGQVYAATTAKTVPRAHQQQADELLRLLQSKDYPGATKLFDETLLEKFPVPEVKKIWELYLKRSGPFLEVMSSHVVDYQNGDFLELRGRWAKAIMVIRLSFDEEDRIDGFWLARDRVGPTPKYFKRGGYLYGPAALRTAGMDHEVTARVVNAAGEAPAIVTVTLWKRVAPSSKKAGIWDDRATGSKWIRCGNDGRYRPPGDKALHGWQRLPAGEYRVSATPGRFEAASGAVSEPFLLDESQRSARLDLRIPDGPSLTVRVIDTDGGQPIEKAFVQLKRKEPGLPPQSWLQVNDVEGVHQIDGLLPARYSLRASKPSCHPDDPKYIREPEESQVEIVAGEDQEVTVTLTKTPLTQQEIDQRWPWIVEGTVTDSEGKGMEGVEIRAFAGRGPTIFCGGRATSDRDGNYVLRYTKSGLHLTNPPPLSVVGGGFYAVKEGYVERNLNRHAKLRVANRLPTGGEWEEHRIPREDSDRIAVPGEPKRIDFVMVPAPLHGGPSTIRFMNLGSPGSQRGGPARPRAVRLVALPALDESDGTLLSHVPASHRPGPSRGSRR